MSISRAKGLSSKESALCGSISVSATKPFVGFSLNSVQECFTKTFRASLSFVKKMVSESHKVISERLPYFVHFSFDLGEI